MARYLSNYKYKDLTIADKLQAKVYYLGTDFSEYLTYVNEHNFFIKPTNPIEIIAYSITNEILHLIKLNTAEPLSSPLNLRRHSAFAAVELS